LIFKTTTNSTKYHNTMNKNTDPRWHPLSQAAPKAKRTDCANPAPLVKG